MSTMPPGPAVGYVFAAALEDFAHVEDPADLSPVSVQISDGTEQGHTIRLKAGHLTYLAALIRRDLEDRYGYGAAYPAEELPDVEPYEVAGAVDDDRPDDIGGFDREGNLR